MRRLSLAGRLVCLALSTSRPAGAQEASPSPVHAPAPPVEVPEVEVEGERPAPEPPASAARRDPTGALTVLPAQGRATLAQGSAELLASAPGTVIQDSGGWGQSKSVGLRGAAANGTLVLLDGMPLNGAGGLVDVSRVPLALAERFEVLRGGAGARYGSGGLGGVINIVTRRAGPTPRVAAELAYGSFDTLLGQASASGPLAGGEALLLVHGGTSSGRFPYFFNPSPLADGTSGEERLRTNNDARAAGALVKWQHALGTGGTVDVLGELSLDERGLAGTVWNPAEDVRQRGGRLSASARLAGSAPGGLQGSVRAWARRDSLELRGGAPAQQGVQLHQVGGVEAEGQVLAGGAHVLSAVLSAGGEALGEVEPSAAPRPEPVWLRASAMAMDEWLLWDGALVVAPSLRVEQAGPYTLLSPKVGLTALLPAGLELRANAGQAWRAPSFLELYVRQGNLLPNSALRPEQALYADAALAYRSGYLTASVGGFASLYTDLIVYEAYPPFAAKAMNVDSALAAGLEAEGEWRPHPWVVGSLAYTLLLTYNLQQDVRYYLLELPNRPRHTLAARVEVGPQWLTGRVELRAGSERLLNRTGEHRLPARAFLHVGLSTRPWGGALTVSAEVQNALDVRAADFDGFPLPGRAVYVSLGGVLETHTQRRDAR